MTSSASVPLQQLCSNCENVVYPNEKEHSKSQKRTECRQNVLMTVMLCGIMANVALSLYTLNVVRDASTQMSSGSTGLATVTSQLSELNNLATQITDALGPKSRLNFNMFPINVPNLINEVLRVNFHPMAVNISRLARSVESVMRKYNEGEGMLSTAQYASLVGSVAKQVEYLKPVTDPNHQPPEDTANNDLLHFMFSALFNVIDMEVDDPKPWAELASTCMEFVDNFVAVNWAGTYTGAHGQRRQWNIMGSIQTPFQAIFDYCSALSNLTQSSQFYLGDMLDMDFKSPDDEDGGNR